MKFRMKETSLFWVKLLIFLGIISLIHCQVKNPVTFVPTVAPQDDDSIPGLYTPEDLLAPDNINTFEWELSKKVMLGSEGSNTIISPISVKVLLTLLWEGSSGATKQELMDLLQLPAVETATRERIQSVLDSLKVAPNPDLELMLGTRVFIDSHFTPAQRFQSIAKQFYGTMVQQLELLSNPGVSVGVINDWIKNGTKSQIQNFLTEEDVNTAVLLLINTIYFKGKWRHQFAANETYPGQFYLNAQEKVPATFMSNTGLYWYHASADLNAKVIRLPYQPSFERTSDGVLRAHHFAMYLFLPNSKNGLPDLLTRLTPSIFKGIQYAMDQVKVQVIIPKVSYEFTSRLGPVLEEMGLTNLFRDTVSLPGISRGQNGGLPSLYVSNVLQKSGIEINEEGSTAYTVSAIALGNKFNSADYIFNASIPFFFSIIDEETGNILYFGKIENPLQKQGEIKNKPGWQAPKPQPVNNKAPIADRISGQAVPPPSPVPSPVPSQVVPEDDTFLDSQTQFNVPDQMVLDRVNIFDTEILHTMCTNREGNVLVSPISIKAVLSMILEGASGLTATELQAALRLPTLYNTRRSYMKNTISKIKQNLGNGVDINIANGIFHSNKLTPLEDFQNVLRTYYYSEFKSVNFFDTQSAANTINNWIKEQTKGVIPAIVNPSSIVPETLVTVINALHFHGIWEKEFAVRDSVFRCFYRSETECYNVYMMHISDTFKFADIPSLDAKAVDLPYKGKQYGMLLLVPNQRSGIDQLVRDLPHTPLTMIYKSLTDMEVQISLPRFKAEFMQDIVPDLQHLNINKLFTYDAELQDITGVKGSVKVDSVIHKVIIDVNEQGSIAAASSAAMIIPLIGSSNPHIRADHPFLFFIHDLQDGNVLFSGRISNPTK